jgi:hypothetical protein
MGGVGSGIKGHTTFRQRHRSRVLRGLKATPTSSKKGMSSGARKSKAAMHGYFKLMHKSGGLMGKSRSRHISAALKLRTKSRSYGG